jgi:hypothetical protein
MTYTTATVCEALLTPHATAVAGRSGAAVGVSWLKQTP